MTEATLDQARARIIRALEVARQTLDDVERIAPLEELGAELRRRGDLWELASTKLHLLKWAIDVTEAGLRRVSGDATTPAIEIPRRLMELYEQKLRPKRFLIGRLSLFAIFEGRDLLSDLAEDLPTGDPYPEDGDESGSDTTITQLAVQSMESLVENPIGLDAITLQAAEHGIELFQGGFFTPDRWYENLQVLRPILLDRQTKVLTWQVRLRLREMYDSFIFGKWLAVFALGGSILEHALWKQGRRFGIEVERMEDGRLRPLGLQQLCDRYCSRYPELRSPMDAIRIDRNRTLHPYRDTNVELLPKALRRDALACIENIRRVLGFLYRDQQGPESEASTGRRGA